MEPDDLIKRILGEEHYALLQKSRKVIDQMNGDPEVTKKYALGMVEKVQNLTKEQTRQAVEEHMVELALMTASLEMTKGSPLMFNDLAIKLFLYGVAIGKELDDEAWEDLKKQL